MRSSVEHAMVGVYTVVGVGLLIGVLATWWRGGGTLSTGRYEKFKHRLKGKPAGETWGVISVLR